MTSREWFQRGRRVIPGGVNSPVRAFNGVGGDPVFVARGSGCRMTTVDGAELVDFCASWGPLLFGHAHPAIVEAIVKAAAEGTTFGVNTPREVEFAERLCSMIPYMEMVRLVTSGTEAVMTAIRLARGFTNRRKIVKFDGCYHGHADYLLVKAGSGLLTGGLSSSAGVSPSAVAEVLVLPYNDLEAVRRAAAEQGSEIAAFIVEPVAGNMGLVQPAPGFLQGLRAAADSSGALLIFDEVITGFRLGPTTYGALCGVTPDLTTLGKIVGGGMPIGALGGRAEVMSKLAPLGPVYQAGTLSGNPVAVAAGLAMLKLISEENPYPRIGALAKRLADGLNAAANAAGVPFHCAVLGSLFTPYFTKNPVRDLASALTADTAAYARFFHAMLDSGYYLAPSQFEVGFVSAVHGQAEIDAFVAAASRAMVMNGRRDS